MDKLNTGERVMGIGGAGLLVSLWLPWFGTKEEDNPFIPPARQVTINAWESFSVSDVLIFLVAAGTLLALLGFLQGASIGSRDRRVLFGVLGGSLFMAGMAFGRIEEPLKSTSTRWGIWVGMLAALAIAVGAWMALDQLGED
jgi:hypothetical protein